MLEGDGEVVEITEREAQEEFEPLRIALDPGQPSAEDVERHRAEGHVPFRSWCEWCVKGRAVGEQHRSGPKSTVPVIASDHLVVTKEGSSRTARSTRRR